MSDWTYISGVLTVSPMGITQAEKRYVLDTVLAHLPLVTGSERDMNMYVILKRGENSSCTVDEFGESTNNLTDSYEGHNRKNGWLRTQDEYLLVVNGSFRDRVFNETLREFNKWICRLAKRISVEEVLVEVKGYNENIIIKNDHQIYTEMFEYPSWCDKKSKNWCEYLLWEKVEE